jgi:multiple sugar transport system ATP-binding protein
MAEVVLKNVQKKFGNVLAVHNFSLTIQDSEFVVFVGPSGCGKSTTLRMIAGLEEVTAGEIYIGDRLVNTLLPKERDTAMVFQNYALYPHMTVFNNMAFGLKLKKLPKQEIEERVRKSARLLGIEDLLHRKPRELSGGQRQRVAVGRAIVRSPQVYLFDEPLSNLDAKLRIQMRVELKKLHERMRTTSIYVTHDQIEAMTMGDRIVVMKDGLIQQVGEPMELYMKPVNRFVAGFLGSPTMNFLPVTIRERNGGLEAVRKGLVLNVPLQSTKPLAAYKEKEVILGIRPEDFTMGEGRELGNLVTATVEVIQPVGCQIYLDIGIGDQNLIASVDSCFRTKPHEQINLRVNLENMHFFDPETDATIS